MDRLQAKRKQWNELFWLLGLIYAGDNMPIWRWFDPTGCEKEMERKVDELHQRISTEHREKKKEGREKIGSGDVGDMEFLDV